MMNYDMTGNVTSVRIIESWATTTDTLYSTDEILEWIEEKNKLINVKIEQVNYNYLGNNGWYYDEKLGEIRNENGSFFQIKGIKRSVNNEVVEEQPIIVQNEIGYLGIIGKVINGVLYFLMQAKIEPGNVNKLQISPTIQATKSNFMRAHGGRAPAYLEFFSNKNNYEIVVDQIQSEQSSRFWGKRNRNIIIVVDDDIKILDSHRWMTLGQIKQLMKIDNLVNMDTRTVISCIPFALRKFTYKELTHIKSNFKNQALFNSIFFGDSGININKIYQYLNEVKMLDNSTVQLVPLTDLNNWSWDENGALSSQAGEFSVIFCDIEIEGREVKHWQQPLLAATSPSIFGLAFCIENDTVLFLVHAKSEIGCFDKIEIGSTVQLNTFSDQESIVDKIFMTHFNQNKGIVFKGLFSEEGGRFYQEQNMNVIMRVNKNDFASLPAGYFWADYQTLNILIQFNNCLNIQLRNLLSILDL